MRFLAILKNRLQSAGHAVSRARARSKREASDAEKRGLWLAMLHANWWSGSGGFRLAAAASQGRKEAKLALARNTQDAKDTEDFDHLALTPFMSKWESLRQKNSKKSSLGEWVARAAGRGVLQATPLFATLWMVLAFGWPHGRANPFAPMGWAASAIGQVHAAQARGFGWGVWALILEALLAACVFSLMERLRSKIGLLAGHWLDVAKKKAGWRSRARTQRAMSALCARLEQEWSQEALAGNADLEWILAQPIHPPWAARDAVQNDSPVWDAESQWNEEFGRCFERWAAQEWVCMPRRPNAALRRCLRARRALARLAGCRWARAAKSMMRLPLRMAEGSLTDAMILATGLVAPVAIEAFWAAQDHARSIAAQKGRKRSAARDRLLRAGARSWSEPEIHAAQTALRERKRRNKTVDRRLAMKKRIQEAGLRTVDRMEQGDQGKNRAPLRVAGRLAGNFAFAAACAGGVAMAASAAAPWLLDPRGASGWLAWGLSFWAHWIGGFVTIAATMASLGFAIECASKKGLTAKSVAAMAAIPILDLAQIALRLDKRTKREPAGGARRWEALELALATREGQARKTEAARQPQPAAPSCEPAVAEAIRRTRRL